MNGETVTITAARLKELERAERELGALNAFGVDNWPVYGEAMRSLGEDDDQ